MAEVIDFSIDAGIDEDVVINYRPNNVVFDLTDYDVKAQLRRTRESSTVALELSTDNALIFINVNAVMLKFRNAGTGALKNAYAYDIIAVKDGSPLIIATGTIFVKSTVTRPIL